MTLYVIVLHLLCLGLIYSQSDASIASELSLIPFQLSPSSKPMLHMGGLQKNNGVRLMSGLQFQPTGNLLIGGVVSPDKTDTDLSIYYHVILGYVPKWKFLNISSNMIQIGMHRFRFGDVGDARWYSFSIMESAQLGSINIKLCWNRLFTQKWERNTILLSTDVKLTKNFHLRPGTIAYFTPPPIEYIPFLFMSLDL